MSIPRNEYPRPTLRRDDKTWLNLNGQWEFAFDFGNSGRDRKMWEAPKYDHEITVPYCPESKLSGIEYIDFIPACWYRREVTLPEGWCTECGRVLIHFGTVDYYSEVRVNGKLAGTHRGGFTPFAVDATEFLKDGVNTISVFAEDNGRNPLQPTGKQVYSSYYNVACDYTRCTGIWQTVWMEYVPKNYIKTTKITPDIDNGKVDVLVTLEGDNSAVAEVKAVAKLDGFTVSETVAKVCGKSAQFELPIPDAKLWTLEEPTLYDLELAAGQDIAVAYFGMRSVSIKGAAIELNHKPVFQRLVLDQQYFPDGIYTAKDDETLIRDIELSKAAGFNGARMHMKVFEPRYIYHADKLGYLLWGEFPNWGLDEKDPASLLSIVPEWLTEIDRDYNHPSIIGWCPFNETSERRNKDVLRTVYNLTHALDPMRPVIDTSGYVHVVTDIYDVHDYEQDPAKFHDHFTALVTGEGTPFINNPRHEKYEGQPYFVSEFGGTYWNIDEDPSAAWGYGQAPKTIEEFYERFEGLINVLLDNPKICAFCYTQLTDVYQEKNGIFAFDRRSKFDLEKLHKIMSRKAAIEK